MTGRLLSYFPDEEVLAQRGGVICPSWNSQMMKELRLAPQFADIFWRAISSPSTLSLFLFFYFSSLLALFISLGCCHKWLQAQWLKTTHTDSLTVLEARSWKSVSLAEIKVLAGPHSLQRLQGINPLPGLFQHLLLHSLYSLVQGLLLHLHSQQHSISSLRFYFPLLLTHIFSSMVVRPRSLFPSTPGLLSLLLCLYSISLCLSLIRTLAIVLRAHLGQDNLPTQDP